MHIIRELHLERNWDDSWPPPKRPVSSHTDLVTFFRYFNPDRVETGRKIDAMKRGQLR